MGLVGMRLKNSEPQMGFELMTLRVLDFFCVLLWLILYISLYFLYNTNISGISFKVK